MIQMTEEKSEEQFRFSVVSAGIAERDFLKRQRNASAILEGLLSGNNQVIVSAANAKSLLKVVRSMANTLGLKVEEVSENKIRICGAVCEEITLEQSTLQGPTHIFGATVDECGCIKL